MKRIILSRKGLDSSSGKSASPIFKDKRLFSIPIPSKNPSPHKYREVKIDGISADQALREASVRSVTVNDYCHLDPDLRKGFGLFGQANSSQSELRKKGVGKGDLFLFFGWFKHFSTVGPELHHLFGWLQIKEVLERYSDIKNYLNKRKILHPHGFGQSSPFPNNALYIGNDRLKVSNRVTKLAGYGLFKKSHPSLILTRKNQPRSKWNFPKKYFGGTKNLFLNRLQWEDETQCSVECRGQGQEYILNAEKNPNIISWAVDLITKYG
ncbi:MAG: hypothetical protein CMQ40_06380 [Gammaproteobacteria bacterium]|nr:hypothetical protein [Gammaproteobacteria bacterium]|tara:strand:+ start:319 stop:1119 length:801 start_codon:yes stop_codon:yes gene_type:complete